MDWAYAGDDQPAGFACNGDLRLHMYVVPLAASPGTRSLLHGPTRGDDTLTL